MPTLTETEHAALAEIRCHARNLTETVSALYWDTPFEGVMLRRLRDDMSKLASLYDTPVVQDILARCPTTRTRWSWDGQTATAHEEVF